MPTPRIRPLTSDDKSEHVRMRASLWPDTTPEAFADEFDGLLADPNQVVFVAERPTGGGLCGMVEASIRAFADPVDEQPCAFVEGWWVDDDLRRQGIGRALIATVEDWARERGFHELGSDALLDNLVSHAAHRALGFEERERIVSFRKWL